MCIQLPQDSPHRDATWLEPSLLSLRAAHALRGASQLSLHSGSSVLSFQTLLQFCWAQWSFWSFREVLPHAGPRPDAGWGPRMTEAWPCPRGAQGLEEKTETENFKIRWQMLREPPNQVLGLDCGSRKDSWELLSELNLGAHRLSSCNAVLSSAAFPP